VLLFSLRESSLGSRTAPMDEDRAESGKRFKT
jgi:hypothetical protein